ncbi:MAG: hypothetical protein NTX64_00425 [Elusimicrobia bacterium]|nr:hypothetical protein [Elusimicrobiota bacterium]
MRLLLDADPPLVRWCREREGAWRTGAGTLGPGWASALAKGAGPLAQATSISYRLHNGGDKILQPAMRLTPQVLDAVRESALLQLEHNGLIYEAMRTMLKLAPDVPHIVLCDSAFFIDLPAVSRLYAVPARLRAGAMRRHGGGGLIHQWAWQRMRERAGRAVSRMISIQLSDHPNIAAIKDGHPVDTTMGFTPVEGIPSHTSCGDIDASVVFELQASGMSMSEINELLSARSGFRALVGKTCGFRDLVRENGDPDQALARKILLYDIVKYVGAFAAVLGGVDALCFVAEDPRQAGPFIKAARRELRFLGNVRIADLQGDLWRIMSRRAAAVEKEN